LFMTNANIQFES